jgi:hypothetical protein
VTSKEGILLFCLSTCLPVFLLFHPISANCRVNADCWDRRKGKTRRCRRAEDTQNIVGLLVSLCDLPLTFTLISLYIASRFSSPLQRERDRPKRQSSRREGKHTEQREAAAIHPASQPSSKGYKSQLELSSCISPLLSFMHSSLS